MGRGIGFIDAHLLASLALSSHTLLWPRDKRLALAAEQLGMPSTKGECSYTLSLVPFRLFRRSCRMLPLACPRTTNHIILRRISPENSLDRRAHLHDMIAQIFGLLTFLNDQSGPIGIDRIQLINH